jgi:hypothetical protein
MQRAFPDWTILCEDCDKSYELKQKLIKMRTALKELDVVLKEITEGE